MKKLITLALLLTLAACSRYEYEPQPARDVSPSINGLRFYALDLIGVEDRRRADSLTPDPEDNVIYDYQADRLMNGATVRLEARLRYLMDKRPAGRENRPHYRVEVELNYLRTQILTGDVLEGDFGKYVVDMETTVIVRRPDSTVLTTFPVSLHRSHRRVTAQGRNPSADQDRQRMLRAIDEVIGELAGTIDDKVAAVR